MFSWTISTSAFRSLMSSNWRVKYNFDAAGFLQKFIAAFQSCYKKGLTPAPAVRLNSF